MFDTVVTSDVLASVATLTTVVSHDISTEASTPCSPMTTYQRLENLMVQRQVWEDEVFRASNDRLYTILQDCYSLYVQTGSNRLLKNQLRTRNLVA